MADVYAYSRDDRIVIGNSCIERVFQNTNDKLRTEKIVNKRVEGSFFGAYGFFRRIFRRI